MKEGNTVLNAVLSLEGFIERFISLYIRHFDVRGAEGRLIFYHKLVTENVILFIVAMLPVFVADTARALIGYF